MSLLDQRRLLPVVEIRGVELAKPRLGDNTADLDRLTRGLAQAGLELAPPRLEDMNRLVRKLRSEDYKVDCVLGFAESRWEIIDVLPAAPSNPALGFAVDLGTSSVVFHLVDLKKGETLGERAVANPQSPYGEDILTRILFARKEANLRKLQALLIETFNRTTNEMALEAGFSPDCVYALAVAGNTAMSHFLTGLDPSNLCREPYIPVANNFPIFRAKDFGLFIHPNALVYVFPNVGSYFGGDLIAGILASGIHRSAEVRMLVDVGTNAEVALGNRDWLIACAGAAGPALEGGVIERGMTAAPGAVDRVRIDPSTFEPEYRVLGGGKPAGVCGSGVIDLVAEMFFAGILTIQGRIDTRIDSPRIVSDGDRPAYILAYGNETSDGRDLRISEIDIGIFLKSKAAMYTILTVITRNVGLTFGDIEKIYFAGTFGSVIDPAMALRIGMIPDLPLETYESVGNASVRGAESLLFDRALFAEAREVCGRITYIELNVNMELMNEFRGALFLPHTDGRLFPSVRIIDRAPV